MTCGPGALRAPARTTDQTEPTMTTKITKLEAATSAHDAAEAAWERAAYVHGQVLRVCRTLREGGTINERAEDVLVDAVRAKIGSKAYNLGHEVLAEQARSITYAAQTEAFAAWTAAIDALEAAEKAAARNARRRAA